MNNNEWWFTRFSDLIGKLKHKIEWYSYIKDLESKKECCQLLEIIEKYSKIPYPVPVIEGGIHTHGESDAADIKARKLDGYLQNAGYPWPTFQLAEIIRVVEHYS